MYPSSGRRAAASNFASHSSGMAGASRSNSACSSSRSIAVNSSSLDRPGRAAASGGKLAGASVSGNHAWRASLLVAKCRQLGTWSLNAKEWSSSVFRRNAPSNNGRDEVIWLAIGPAAMT